MNNFTISVWIEVVEIVEFFIEITIIENLEAINGCLVLVSQLSNAKSTRKKNHSYMILSQLYEVIYLE